MLRVSGSASDRSSQALGPGEGRDPFLRIPEHLIDGSRPSPGSRSARDHNCRAWPCAGRTPVCALGLSQNGHTGATPMLVMDAITEILKREGISTLFSFPTTPIIEAAV